jgi:hypothetical protein
MTKTRGAGSADCSVSAAVRWAAPSSHILAYPDIDFSENAKSRQCARTTNGREPYAIGTEQALMQPGEFDAFST